MPIWQLNSGGTADNICGTEHLMTPPGNIWQLVDCAIAEVHDRTSTTVKPKRVFVIPNFRCLCKVFNIPLSSIKATKTELSNSEVSPLE
jgi:hypothetical protein